MNTKKSQIKLIQQNHRHQIVLPNENAARKDNRKYKRELSFTQTTHTILRLKPQLPPLFEPRDLELRTLFFKIAKKYDIKIYHLIFNHTHMHAVLHFKSRSAYVAFIRELTSMITAHFNHQLKFLRANLSKIFDQRPYTRSVQWGRAYKVLQNYMLKNEKESGQEQRLFNYALQKLYKLNNIKFQRNHQLDFNLLVL